MIVKLKEGLGNQMFQYAFAKALEHAFKCKVMLSDSYYRSEENKKQVSVRKLDLTDFNITLDIVDEKYEREFCFKNDKWYALSTILREKSKIANFFIRKILPKRFRHEQYKYLVLDKQNDANLIYAFKMAANDKMMLRKEPKNLNRKKIPIANEACVFQGWFLYTDYFHNIRDILLHDFTLKKPLDSKNKAMKDKISATESIMMHIRLGDYLKVDHAMRLGLAYYNGALKAIKRRVDGTHKLHVFVFSNGMQWCKDNLLGYLDSNITKDMEFVFVDINGEDGAVCELELMRSCKHSIIAGSTFSWWAAYLNTNARKIVVCPYTFLSFLQYKQIGLCESFGEWVRLDYAWGEETKVYDVL